MTPTPNRALFTLLLISSICLLPSASAQEIKPLDSSAYAAQPRSIVEPVFDDIPPDYPLPESITATLKVLADGSISEMIFPDPSDEKLTQPLRTAARQWLMYPAIGKDCLPTQSTQMTTVYFKRDKAGKVGIDISTGGATIHRPDDSLPKPKIIVVARDKVWYPRDVARRGINAGLVVAIGRVGPGDTISDFYIYLSSPRDVFDRAVMKALDTMRIKLDWGTDQPRADFSACYSIQYKFRTE